MVLFLGGSGGGGKEPETDHGILPFRLLGLTSCVLRICLMYSCLCSAVSFGIVLGFDGCDVVGTGVMPGSVYSSSGFQIHGVGSDSTRHRPMTRIANRPKISPGCLLRF